MSRGSKAVPTSTVSKDTATQPFSQGWQGEAISNEYLLGEKKPPGISTLSFTVQMYLKVQTLPDSVNAKAVITVRFKECKIKLQVFPERSCFLNA